MNNDTNYIDHQEIFDYLNKRKGIIDGICISGGEPTVQKGLIDFIKKIKAIGIKVKLDTNGSNPKVLEELIDNNLVDYVAMDIKNVFTKYSIITNAKPKIADLKESMRLLKNSKIDYEFRTTVVKEFHEYKDLEEIATLIGKSNYYLQKFEDSDNVLSKGLHSYEDEELLNMFNKLKEKFPNIGIRGIKIEKEKNLCTK